jgi:osmotically-inducible protein OsmY
MKDRQDIDDVPDSEIEVEPPDDPGAIDPAQAVEEAEPYFPPTDPVVRQAQTGETEIAGGFGTGEVPEFPAHAVTQDVPSDEALEDAVHRQLRLDASTAHLHLNAEASQGVVRLQGSVDDEADAENALAIAGDVPGVVEVIDELTRT